MMRSKVKMMGGCIGFAAMLLVASTSTSFGQDLPNEQLKGGPTPTEASRLAEITGEPFVMPQTPLPTVTSVTTLPVAAPEVGEKAQVEAPVQLQSPTATEEPRVDEGGIEKSDIPPPEDGVKPNVKHAIQPQGPSPTMPPRPSKDSM